MDTGDLVPDFELPDQDGTPRRLSTLLQNGPVVLFFYPAAMTTGCTKEACHFRDVGAEYAAAGVQRVGISRDTVAKQKQFADQHSFDYPLLSDEDGKVAEIFGVKRGGLLGKLAGDQAAHLRDRHRQPRRRRRSPARPTWTPTPTRRSPRSPPRRAPDVSPRPRGVRLLT